MSRIGIFSGSFDPVHVGHITFALLAMKEAQLDKVYFLPELKPRRKPEVTHISHRIAMLRLATMPYANLELLEFPDRQFSVAKTMPRLHQRFHGDQVFLLLGADVLEFLPDWPLAKRLLNTYGLIVAQRKRRSDLVEVSINALPVPPQGLYILQTTAEGISSSHIRQAVIRHESAKGLLPSTGKYIKKHWVYSSAPAGSNNS